jgi:zinc ribbon protein
MSSETSTEPQPSFEPWQLFTLAGLIGATIAVFMARGESPAAVIMISLTIFAAAAVGIAALRTFLPLTQKSSAAGPRMLGGRTRGALEREKTLLLRSIKELEFDRAMGKVSEKDFAEMSGRLRVRAARLMRQLDAGAGYRSEIEKEIAKRMGEAPAGPTKQDPAHAPSRTLAGVRPTEDAGRVLVSIPAVACPSCGTSNDADARFCKHCGHSMEARS